MWRQNTRQPEPAETARIRELVPMSELSATSFAKLVELSKVSPATEGEYLFQAGDNDALSIFLLQGRVELDSGSSRLVVEAGSDTSRYALANLKPRKFTGRALSDSTLLQVDSTMLEKIMAWDQASKGSASGVQVVELDPGDDPEWSLHLLGNPIFMRIPAGSIETLISRFEPVPVKAGDTIIEQGEAGDAYYIIRSGECDILRRSGDHAQPVKYAEGRAGDGVGEEALISDNPRDATVRMTTDGLLMKLNKIDFDQLVKEPLLSWVDEARALSLMDEGASLIDVRLEEEYARHTLAGAMNVPLYLLRLRMDRLDRNRHHLVFCDTGERSAVAAFLLETAGLTASIIRGGLNACPRLQAPGG